MKISRPTFIERAMGYYYLIIADDGWQRDFYLSIADDWTLEGDHD